MNSINLLLRYAWLLPLLLHNHLYKGLSRQELFSTLNMPRKLIKSLLFYSVKLGVLRELNMKFYLSEDILKLRASNTLTPLYSDDKYVICRIHKHIVLIHILKHKIKIHKVYIDHIVNALEQVMSNEVKVEVGNVVEKLRDVLKDKHNISYINSMLKILKLLSRLKLYTTINTMYKIFKTL